MSYYPALGLEVTGNPNHLILHGMANPITGRMIMLTPPVEMNSAETYEAFKTWISAYCLREWGTTDDMGVHHDPVTIDASNWRESHPGS